MGKRIMTGMDFSERRGKLLRAMKKADLPAMLITNPVNVSYLTGFTGEDSYLYLSAKEAIVLSDARFEEQLQTECPGLKCEIRHPPVKMLELLEKVLKAVKANKVGIEAAAITLDFHLKLADKFKAVEFVPTEGQVETLREIKDKFEVDAIRKAIDVAQRAFAVVRAALRSDKTEKNVADELEQHIREFGGLRSSFQTIVGVGPRAALPHGRPSERRIEESEFVLIDWGARVGQYISDLTRVLVTGKIPPKLERLYGVVLKANQAAIEAIRPGALMKEVDAAARNVITKAGYGKEFNHSLGHGIGLEVHESPRLAMDQERPLQAGMVITVEPGIYFPGWGGIRIEDDILVTKSGHELLSTVPKQFAECVLS
jgi:Xaa-Pro aminopeptidase